MSFLAGFDRGVLRRCVSAALSLWPVGRLPVFFPLSVVEVCPCADRRRAKPWSAMWAGVGVVASVCGEARDRQQRKDTEMNRAEGLFMMKFTKVPKTVRDRGATTQQRRCHVTPRSLSSGRRPISHHRLEFGPGSGRVCCLRGVGRLLWLGQFENTRSNCCCAASLLFLDRARATRFQLPPTTHVPHGRV